ncbi:MAG: SpoIIE family protein phosphatase [Methylococcaceae bacterium]
MKIGRYFSKKIKNDISSIVDFTQLLLPLQTNADVQQIRQLTKHLWLRYGIAVTLIAGLSVTSYLIVINLNFLNENNGALVQTSARQLTLVEQAGRLSTRLTLPIAETERNVTRERLRQIIDELANQHAVLRDGKIEGSQLPLAMEIFVNEPYRLNQRFLVFQSLVQRLLDMTQFASGDTLVADIEQLFVATDDLAPALRALSKVYEEAGVSKIYRAIEIETYVALGTLLVLVLEIVWIFRPTIGRVRKTAVFLQQQAALSQNIVATAQAFVMGLDNQGRIVLFNRYSEYKTGWSYQDIMGSDFAQYFLPQEQHARFLRLRAELAKAQNVEEFESTFVTRTGSILAVRWHFTPVCDPESGRTLLLMVTGVDLTDLKAAALSLEAALNETRTLSERLHEEVTHAARLQRSLLPPPQIMLPGVTGSAILTTCTEVGGDYYDYYSVDGHYAVVIVADASGHGVAAGSLVSCAKIAVRHLSEHGETDPARILSFINHALLTSTHESMFMTMGCLCLDSATGLLRYASAGHVFPYLRSKDAEHFIWQAIENVGVPLGRVAEAEYQNTTLEMQLGERLFLYTDGLVEERSPTGEQLGFEQLEKILDDYGTMSCDETVYWIQNVLEQHCGSVALSDDVTLLVLDFSCYCTGDEGALVNAPADKDTLLRLSDETYRLGGNLVDSYVARQYVVFLAKQPFTDLLARFCLDGIRRVLPIDASVSQVLGLPKLLAQHHLAASEDLYRLMGKCSLQRQFPLSHSDEKEFIKMEIAGLLQSQVQISREHADTLLLLVDELIENALYAAPRDLSNQPLYLKASEREVSYSEGIQLDFALNDEWLGLMVTDLWGTLTPEVFLRRLALNEQLRGLQAGVGGAGLFLTWKLSDYLQIRVLPRRKTQVTVLWHLGQALELDNVSGFQFLYHTETDEYCELNKQDVELETILNKDAYMEALC